jgi:glycerol-3-phosphate cytidylyltransferase-like family protein
MQVISRFTREELENKNDPLDLSCHAINRLRFVGTTVMNATAGLDSNSLDDYSGEDIFTMGEIISDSTDELEKLIDISQKKNRELLRENRLLKGKLEAMEAEVTS